MFWLYVIQINSICIDEKVLLCPVFYAEIGCKYLAFWHLIPEYIIHATHIGLHRLSTDTTLGSFFDV